MSELGELLEEFESDIGIAPKMQPRQARAPVNLSGILGPGVYALCWQGEIVYVGKAKVLIQRLYAHWNNLCRHRSGKEVPERFKLIEFDNVKITPCKLFELDLLEKQMISRHRPRLNKRLVPEGKLTLEQIGFDYTKLGVTKVVETPIYRRPLG